MWRYRDVFYRSLGAILVLIFASAVFAKPLSPIQVSIEPLESPVPGKPVQFVVRTKVSIDAEDLQVIVNLPRGVVLNEGQLNWHGPVLKGDEKSLQFVVTSTNSATMSATTSEEKVIQVYAFIPGTDNSQLSAAAFYRFGFTANAVAAKASAVPGSRIVERAGRKIQEYELRP